MLEVEQKHRKVKTTYPYIIRVLSKDTFLIDGRVWYNRYSYIRELGFSGSSIGLPYSHVRAFKADFMDICGMKIFSPIRKGATE